MLSCPQALENSWEFPDPAPSELFELVEKERLESLEDHAICSFNLSVGVLRQHRSSLFLFSCLEEEPSSWSSRLALPVVRPSVKTASTASSLEAWFLVMSRSSRVVCGFR
jgi:hypothetical protein